MNILCFPLHIIPLHITPQILLHGLIYIAEGKELPKLDTYLICRAFWKEDKSRSQICNDTKNPFYQFCQVTTSFFSILRTVLYYVV